MVEALLVVLDKHMYDFQVDWDGKSEENLSLLLDKTQVNTQHDGGASLNAHLITVRKSSSIADVIALWMGYPGVPESVKSSPLFLSLLSIVSLALLSPRSLKLLPDSAGEILQLFEKRGFFRVLTRKRVFELLGSAKIASDGISFLLERRLVEEVDDGVYKLLEVPLNNVKIGFTRKLIG